MPETEQSTLPLYRLASQSKFDECQAQAGDCPDSITNHTNSRWEELKMELAKVCPQEREYRTMISNKPCLSVLINEIDNLTPLLLRAVSRILNKT